MGVNRISPLTHRLISRVAIVVMHIGSPRSVMGMPPAISIACWHPRMEIVGGAGVAEALVEHQGQDVVLVVLPSGLSAQDVRRTQEVGLDLLEGERHAGPGGREQWLLPFDRFNVLHLDES